MVSTIHLLTYGVTIILMMDSIIRQQFKMVAVSHLFNICDITEAIFARKIGESPVRSLIDQTFSQEIL